MKTRVNKDKKTVTLTLNIEDINQLKHIFCCAYLFFSEERKASIEAGNVVLTEINGKWAEKSLEAQCELIKASQKLDD